LFAGKALALFARLLGPGAHRQRRRHDGEGHRFGQGCNEFAPRRRSLTCRTGSRLIARLSEGYPETEGRQMGHPQSGECERKDRDTEGNFRSRYGDRSDEPNHPHGNRNGQA
jgi:hypothetical protein